MISMIKSSLISRVIIAVLSCVRTWSQNSRLYLCLCRMCKGSCIIKFCVSFFQREAQWCHHSSTAAVLQLWNDRFACIELPAAAFHNSVIGRFSQLFFHFGSDSILVGRILKYGTTGILLAAIAFYSGIHFFLRDILPVPIFSAVWDELFMLIAMVWIVRQRICIQPPVVQRLNPLDFPLLCFITIGFYLMNTVFWFYGISLAGYRATVQYMLWYLIVTRMIRHDNDLMILYYGLVVFAALISIHGIYQYIAAVPIPSNWTDQAEQSVRTRVFSIFGSPNIMADYMVMFAPMAAGLAYYLKKPWHKLLAWICTACMCFACLFTMSRAGWMAMALAVVVFCLLVDKRLLFLLVAVGFGACFIPFVASRIGYLFTEQFAESTARGGRSIRWATGYQYLIQSGRPMVGLGLGMFGGAIAVQNKIVDQWKYFYMDNYYMKILAEMGYIGLAAFLILAIFVILVGLRAFFRSKAVSSSGLRSMSPLCAGMLSGLAGVFLHCYFENIFEEPYMMVHFWTLAAMIVYIGFLRQDGNVKNTVST